MQTSDFDYFLPHELIAQSPQEPRDACKLLVLDRRTGAVSHEHFFDLPKYMRKGDVLVVNTTKVFKARLLGHLKGSSKSGVEIFLLKPIVQGGEACVWEALGKPGYKLKPGTVIEFSQGFACTIGTGFREGGVMEVIFDVPYGTVMNELEHIGHIPVPPYIKNEPRTLKEYQTVYAREIGSVAAPTAGFHFTPELIAQVQAQGVELVELVLHVGTGTFKPVKAEIVEEHVMHSEYVEISADAAHAICRAKEEGRRVIAVGTTVVRALEGVWQAQHADANASAAHLFSAFHGEVNLFITHGFAFHVVDALITNFHLPKSTLLMLVAAFAGRERAFSAYEEAKLRGYTFFSFGDAMLIKD